MAAGRGRGGASPAGSNHPALACASAAPPCPRRGILSLTYVAGFYSLLATGQRRRSTSAGCFPELLSGNAKATYVPPDGAPRLPPPAAITTY